jgi:hypothetical protein
VHHGVGIQIGSVWRKEHINEVEPEASAQLRNLTVVEGASEHLMGRMLRCWSGVLCSNLAPATLTSVQSETAERLHINRTRAVR